MADNDKFVAADDSKVLALSDRLQDYFILTMFGNARTLVCQVPCNLRLSSIEAQSPLPRLLAPVALGVLAPWLGSSDTNTHCQGRRKPQCTASSEPCAPPPTKLCLNIVLLSAPPSFVSFSLYPSTLTFPLLAQLSPTDSPTQSSVFVALRPWSLRRNI